jgi:hypothetical protein
MVNMLQSNGVFLNGMGGSRKGEMCKMTQEVGIQKRKGQLQMWTKYEQTVNQQCYLGSADKVTGICSEEKA